MLFKSKGILRILLCAAIKIALANAGANAGTPDFTSSRCTLRLLLFAAMLRLPSLCQAQQQDGQTRCQAMHRANVVLRESI